MCHGDIATVYWRWKSNKMSPVPWLQITHTCRSLQSVVLSNPSWATKPQLQVYAFIEPIATRNLIHPYPYLIRTLANLTNLYRSGRNFEKLREWGRAHQVESDPSWSKGPEDSPL